MFNQQEVQILLGGVNSPVDLKDLRAHTQYGGVYDNDEATITAFWNVSQIYISAQLASNVHSRLSTTLTKSNGGRSYGLLRVVVDLHCCSYLNDITPTIF